MDCSDARDQVRSIDELDKAADRGGSVIRGPAVWGGG